MKADDFWLRLTKPKCYRCKKTLLGDYGYCERCFQMNRARHAVDNIRQIAKKFGVVNELVIREWFEILERAEGCCFYCQEYIGLEELVIEHQTPMSRGGPNTKDNVVPACRSCNSKKRSRTAEEFAVWKAQRSNPT